MSPNSLVKCISQTHTLTTAIWILARNLMSLPVREERKSGSCRGRIYHRKGVVSVCMVWDSTESGVDGGARLGIRNEQCIVRERPSHLEEIPLQDQYRPLSYLQQSQRVSRGRGVHHYAVVQGTRGVGGVGLPR